MVNGIEIRIIFDVLYELSVYTVILCGVLLIALRVLKGESTKDFQYTPEGTNIMFKSKRSDLLKDLSNTEESDTEDRTNLKEDVIYETETETYGIKITNGQMNEDLKGVNYHEMVNKLDDFLENQDSELERIQYLVGKLKPLLKIGLVYSGVYYLLTIFNIIQYKTQIQELGNIIQEPFLLLITLIICSAILKFSYEDKVFDVRKERKLKQTKIREGV